MFGNKREDETLKVPKVYTGIVVLGKAYSVLVDVGIDWIMTGNIDTEIDFNMIRKQATGEGSFDEKKLAEEFKKLNKFVFDIVDKLLGTDRKLIEFYEIITKTDVKEEDDPDIEIVLEAVVNFFLDIVKKVPRFIGRIMVLQSMKKSL